MSRFSEIDRMLRDATGVEYTGAVARIEHRGHLVFEEAYGATRDDEAARAVYADTRFDLASLTKLFVATLALQNVANGALALDEPLAPILQEWRDDARARITARMLLAHTSGMNSGADYRAILDRNVEAFALGSELIAAPGERVIYSDLGFMALGAALECVNGRSLAALARHAFPSLEFRPPARERLAIPATEDDGWRGRVQGFVHDEKAYLMGGVAGHAGLFGSAADVAALTESYLAAHRGRDSALLPEALALEATRQQAYDPVLRRGLGWALKTNDENSCGRLMDASSFGHTGFVGTCVWADPARDAQAVLLTNNVYFGRDGMPGTGQALRPRFYEATIAALER